MHPETVISPVPAFINVQVTALPSGKPGKYTITCLTDPVLVSGATILNFQLIPGTPADVVFIEKISKNPRHKHQLSDPSVSTDGKMLTLSDVDTWSGSIEVTFYVTDKDKGEHGFDPQIRNEPQR